MYSKGKFNKSIKKKIVIQVTILIAFILAISIACVVYLRVDFLQENAQIDLKNRSEKLANDIERRLQYLQESTELLAEHELLINAFVDENDKNKYLTPLVNNFKKGKYLSTFSVVDFDGRMVFQTDNSSSSFAQSNELRFALSLSQTVSYFNLAQNEVVFIVPIRYYDTTQGAIIATYNMANLIEMYTQNEAFIYTKFYQKAVEIHSQNYNKDENYYKYNLLDNSNYRLLHKLNINIEMGMIATFYLKPLKKEIPFFIFFGILILALGMWISYYLATTITHPILALYEKINQLPTNNEKDEYEPLGSDDELEILGYAFYKKEKELELFNKELSFKVEAATKDLSEQRNFNHSLVESANSIIAVINKDGVMTNINPYGENFLGCTQEEISSEPYFWSRFLPKDIQDKVFGVFERAKKGEIVKQFQNAWTSKSGETRIFEWSNSLIKDEDGNVKYLTTIGVDITNMISYQKELEIAKEAAEKANKIKSEFLANMSHEIRTPLNGVLGLTELVLKTDLTAQQKEYLQKAKASSEALLYIINDVLDYSKMEAGKLDLEHRAFKLAHVMQNIQDLFEYQANQKGIAFNIIGDYTLTLVGDPLRLTQILTNIVGNAIKFTQEGFIDIKIELLYENEHHKKLKFSIKDSGIGMNQEVQRNLFTKFTQADSSITRQFGGTGLGLSISKHLVQMMSGEIWVESQEKKGSTFIFTVTFEKQDENQEDIAEEFSYIETVKADLLQGATILLVEDNKINQMVAIGMLENLKINVEVANNGKEAVLMIEANPYEYDLILMDLQMPIMDGFESSNLIKKINQDIPIVALSAAVMQEDIIKSSQAQMSAHLSKPINEEKLIATLLKFIAIKEFKRKEIKENINVSLKEGTTTYYGVDLKDLSQRIGNNPKIIEKILQNFCDEYANAHEIFDLSHIQTDEFNRAIHSLKGVSGNISLPEIYLLSKQIYETDDVLVKKELTQKLIWALKETTTQLKIQLAVKNQSVVQKVHHKDEVISYLTQIQKDILSFKAISTKRVTLLEEMLTFYVKDEIIKELCGYLFGYKYKEAHQVISHIFELLEQSDE